MSCYVMLCQTGKTLTARILASKCERPLVVLQVDKIVSKWYGDSEKTLAKVNLLDNNTYHIII